MEITIHSSPWGFYERIWRSVGLVKKPHPDVSLVSRVNGGDSDALAVILERYWASLVQYATGILHNRDDAADVVLETFERLWERRDAWQVDGSVLPLLLRMTRNLSLDTLRRRSARERANKHAAEPCRFATPSAVVEEQELRKLVAAAVDALPERRREVLLLIRIHGLSRKEVASVMDLAPQTVANHLKLAMDDLRKILGPYFHEASAISIKRQTDASA